MISVWNILLFKSLKAKQLFEIQAMLKKLLIGSNPFEKFVVYVFLDKKITFLPLLIDVFYFNTKFYGIFHKHVVQIKHFNIQFHIKIYTTQNTHHIKFSFRKNRWIWYVVQIFGFETNKRIFNASLNFLTNPSEKLL